jgi:hypothetical protein
MSEIGRIDATWTAAARTELERFIVNARVPGAILSLVKSADDPNGNRWFYSVFTLERIRALEAVMQPPGHPLLHLLDGTTVVISNSKHARELDGQVLDYDGPGYLIARAQPAPLRAAEL